MEPITLEKTYLSHCLSYIISNLYCCTSLLNPITQSRCTNLLNSIHLFVLLIEQIFFRSPSSLQLLLFLQNTPHVCWRTSSEGICSFSTREGKFSLRSSRRMQDAKREIYELFEIEGSDS